MIPKRDIKFEGFCFWRLWRVGTRTTGLEQLLQVVDAVDAQVRVPGYSDV